MSREIVFLPEVARDFVEGFNYYESLSPGRGGDRFEASFNQALRQICDGMVTHLKVFGFFHRAFVPGFPYNIYYRPHGDRTVIVAVLYSRFDPARIESTLRSRKVD